MNILIISGTNRLNSKSMIIAKIYQSLIEKSGGSAEILDLSLLPADFTSTALYENSGKNEGFNVFREKIQRHTKFAFIVAEYNGSFPGILKTFIDGLKYPDSFKNKKAALVGLSSGIQGGAIALSHLSDICSYLGMHVLGNRVKLYRIEENLKNGIIENKLFNDLLEVQVKDLIAF